MRALPLHQLLRIDPVQLTKQKENSTMPTKRKSGKSSTTSKKAAKKSPAKPSPSSGLSEVIGKALTDKEFRTTLFKNRPSALRGYRLSKGDRSALDSLTEKDIEEHAAQLGAGASPQWTIKIVITKHF